MIGLPSIRFLLVLGITLGLIHAAGGAEPESPIRPEGSIARIYSINPHYPDSDDLAPILEAIGNARIVVLAASTPGDGATHWARCRIAEALIDRAGFSVIAFEAGYYDCRVMNAQFAAGTDAGLTPKAGLPGQLADSGYLQPLYRTIWKSYFKPQPVEVCGFDYRHTGKRTARQLPRDLFAYLSQLKPNPLTKEQRRKYLTVLERLAQARENGDDTGVVQSWEQLHELRAVLKSHRDELVEADSQAEFDAWVRIADDAIVNAQDAMAFGVEDETLSADTQRQQHMGNRLVELARTTYPNRRIIVFCYALTALADPANLDSRTDPDFLGGFVSAGQAWRETFGDDLFTIAFTSARGTSGWIQGPQIPVPQPSAGSVEFKLAAQDWPFLFVPLKTTSDPWWNRSRQSSLTGINRRLRAEGVDHQTLDISAIWPNQFDSIFFIDEMFPNNWQEKPPEGAVDSVHIE